MAFNIKLTKEDYLKIFALVVVVAFVFEIFAINQGNSNQIRVANGNSTASDLDNFDGTGTANATILSWDPSLVVSDGGSAADAEIAKLKSEGFVAYSAKSGNSTIVSLSGRSAFAEASRRLLSTNSTVTGYATVALSSIRVDGPSVSRNITSDTFRLRLSPLFETGDSVQVGFSASVQGGRLVGIGNLQFEQSPPLTVFVQPQEVEIRGEFYTAQVPWEMRNAINASALSNTLGGANVTYRKRSLITFDPALTSAQTAALSSAMPSFAISLQANSLSVAGSFTDSKAAAEQIYALGANAVFPPSIIEIRAGKDGAMPTYNQTQDALNDLGMNMTIGSAFDLAITLPQEIEVAGKNYSLVRTSLELTSDKEPAEGDVVALQFVPIGRVVAQIDRAQMLSLDSLINATQIDEPAASEGSLNATDTAAETEDGINSTIAANAPLSNATTSEGA